MQTSFLHSLLLLFPVSILSTDNTVLSLPANRRLDDTFRQIDFWRPFNPFLFAPHECPKRYFPDTGFTSSLFPDIYSRSYTSRTGIRCRPALFKLRPLKEASNTNPVQGSFPDVREHPNHNTTFRTQKQDRPPLTSLTTLLASKRDRPATLVLAPDTALPVSRQTDTIHVRRCAEISRRTVRLRQQRPIRCHNPRLPIAPRLGRAFEVRFGKSGR